MIETNEEIYKRQIEGTITIEELKEWLKLAKIKEIQDTITNFIPKNKSDKSFLIKMKKMLIAIENNDNNKLDDGYNSFDKKH